MSEKTLDELKLYAIKEVKKARSAWPGAGICGAQYDSFERKK